MKAIRTSRGRMFVACEWGSLFLFSCAALAQSQQVEVQGTVRSSTGAAVVDALVVPIRDSDARPLLAPMGQPIESPQQLWEAAQAQPASPDTPRLLYAYTDREGRFSFRLPTGKYRFIAASTPGSEAPPIPLAIASVPLELHGVSDTIDLRKRDMADVDLRPLGNCELQIETGIANDDAYLFLSQKPLAADPILGFACWDARYMQGLLAVVRLDNGQCRIRGLPAGVVHAAVFANDNNPGFGGMEIRLGEAAVRQRIPIVASWSNGHKEPPEKLAPLVDRFEREPAARQAVEAHWEKCMAAADQGNEPQNPLAMFATLQQHLSDSIELPGGETLNFADAAAALAYLRLRKGAG